MTERQESFTDGGGVGAAVLGHEPVRPWRLWFPLSSWKEVCAVMYTPFICFHFNLILRTALHRGRDWLCKKSTTPEPGPLIAASAEHLFPPPSGQMGSVQPYHSYRIPALLSLGEPYPEVLLAFVEGRMASVADWGRIDLVMRRSMNGGRTWSDLTVVCSGEALGLDGATVGNPCACWDSARGRVVLLFTVTTAGAAEPAVWCGRAPPRRVFVTFSDDGGASWRQAHEVSDAVRGKGWTWYATGPGRSLQLQHGPHAGRILAPCDHVRTTFHPRCFPRILRLTSFALRSHFIFSDDGGETWQVGGIGPPQTNECQAAELADGSVLMSMRDFSGRRRRRFAVSPDSGCSLVDIGHSELREPLPASCQASLLAVPAAAASMAQREPLLLYAGIAGEDRRDLRLRQSADAGRHWPSDAPAVRLHPGPAAYSCLELLGSGGKEEVGVLFEAGDAGPYESIRFCRLPLANWQGAARK